MSSQQILANEIHFLAKLRIEFDASMQNFEIFLATRKELCFKLWGVIDSLKELRQQLESKLMDIIQFLSRIKTG
jgi:hypothetical protein